VKVGRMRRASGLLFCCPDAYVSHERPRTYAITITHALCDVNLPSDAVWDTADRESGIKATTPISKDGWILTSRGLPFGLIN
jgi:hypothetical protein